MIAAVLGLETPTGEFEVVDICTAGLAPNPSQDLKVMDVDSAPDEWVGIISGLDIGSLSPADAQIQMLIEYLSGEGGGPDDQAAASNVSRLIIAGNSFAPFLAAGADPEETPEDKKPVRFIVSSQPNAEIYPH